MNEETDHEKNKGESICSSPSKNTPFVKHATLLCITLNLGKKATEL